jgi:hypothetical protein
LISIAIPSATTPAVDPKATPSGVKVTPTASGGVQVSSVDEPVVGTPAAGDPSKLILGKFKTQADLEAAYKELESKNGKPPVTPETTPATVAPATGLNIETATKLLTDKGLDYMEFANQYAADGALSSASYEKLIGKGITAQQIDKFLADQAPIIAAQKAAADVAAKDVKDHVGGEAEFAKLIDFVAKTLSPAEIASYNRTVDAGDTTAAKILLTNFKGKRDATLGVEPTLNGGVPPSSGSQDVYQMINQYHSDLRDPRYEKDAYFRKKVDAKLKNSRQLYYPS